MKTTKEKLRKTLSGQGLTREPLTIPGVEMWIRSNQEVTSFFAPGVVRKGNAVQILGLVGIYIMQFEIHWQELLKTYYPKEKKQDSILFGTYLTNIITDPPYIYESNEDIAISDSLKRIMELMEKFPSDVRTVITDLSNKKLGPYEARFFVSDRVKWIAFIVWLKESSFSFPNDLIQLNKMRSVEQYEAIYEALKKHI